MRGRGGSNKELTKGKKEDISMTSFPKTEYWGLLVTNVESLDEKTNPSSKHYCAPSVAKYKAEFVLVKYIFQYTSASLRSNQLTKYE